MRFISVFHIVVVFAALSFGACKQTNAAELQDVVYEDSQSSGCNLSWLRDMGVCPDSLIIGDTVPNAFSCKGVYLDSMQIQRLIADNIPNRESCSISSIRLFSIKELSDSIAMCTYVYEFSDIEDIYMVLYKSTSATDVLKLPVPEMSDIDTVTDDVEYINYFKSNVEFTDDAHFMITEVTSTKGWNIDGKCVFKSSLSAQTSYSISTDGKIHKKDVVKTQSCPAFFE